MVLKRMAYLKSLPALLKLLEFVLLLAAIATVAYFMDNTSGDYIKKGNLQFFLFVVIVGWFLVIALFVIFLTGLCEKLSLINWALTVAVLSAVWTILLLISSALLSDAARYYDEKNTCKFLDNYKRNARCKQLIGGAVCGLITMVLFTIDGFFHLRMYLIRHDATTEPCSG